MGDTRRKLLESLKERNYVNYPIENEMLKSETDYIKNNYFRYLALVLRQEGEVSDGARALFQRMLVGAQMEGDMAVYMRQALEATIDAYAEFMSQLLGKPLRCRFLLDAILLACCDTEDEEVLELIAAYMESLKIRTDEAAYLCAMGKSILEQESKLYWRAWMNPVSSIPTLLTDDYTKGYVCDSVTCEDHVLEIYFKEKTEVDLKRLLAGKQMGEQFQHRSSAGAKTQEAPGDILTGLKKIVIHNAVFTLSDGGLEVHDCGNITFSSCEFLNGKYEILAENTGKISFVDCQFTCFESRVIHVENVSEVTIADSRFEKCYLEEERYKNDMEIGGIIYTGDRDKCGLVMIHDATFVKCCVINEAAYYIQDIISNCKCQVKDSFFENCWGHDYRWEIIIEKERNRTGHFNPQTLFHPGTIKNNNKMVNSVSFS